MHPTQTPSAGSKLLLSFGLILVSTIYAVWQSLGAGQRPASVQQSTISQSYQAANQALQQTLAALSASTTPAPTSAPTPVAPASAPVSKPKPMMTGPMMHTGLYADGSYTGAPADAYYGTVQVKVIVSGGRISDVQFLQHPSDRSTSVYINDQAMPLLTQEAIQAQSANVSGVSGATETSGAFVQSLASALALAKN